MSETEGIKNESSGVQGARAALSLGKPGNSGKPWYVWSRRGIWWFLLGSDWVAIAWQIAERFRVPENTQDSKRGTLGNNLRWWPAAASPWAWDHHHPQCLVFPQQSEQNKPRACPGLARVNPAVCVVQDPVFWGHLWWVSNSEMEGRRQTVCAQSMLKTKSRPAIKLSRGTPHTSGPPASAQTSPKQEVNYITGVHSIFHKP